MNRRAVEIIVEVFKSNTSENYFKKILQGYNSC